MPQLFIPVPVVGFFPSIMVERNIAQYHKSPPGACDISIAEAVRLGRLSFNRLNEDGSVTERWNKFHLLTLEVYDTCWKKLSVADRIDILVSGGAPRTKLRLRAVVKSLEPC